MRVHLRLYLNVAYLCDQDLTHAVPFLRLTVDLIR